MTVLNKILLSMTGFRKNEDGAVTVDFVVLVATTVMLGLAVVNSFDDEVLNVANDIADSVGNVKVR